ncbi:trypsin-like peptidase domain-containing protein [Candidatus Dependentiae bacterium]|nr:trypsin-like peptidase domain-containing protein [Candidatus Dependentiae bacterium]
MQLSPRIRHYLSAFAIIGAVAAFAGVWYWYRVIQAPVCPSPVPMRQMAAKQVDSQATAPRADESAVEQQLERTALKELALLQPWAAMQAGMQNAVVQVFTQHAQFNWLQPYKTPDQVASSGSGFFINEEGDLITNAHVVDEAMAISIQIQSLGKEMLDVTIVGFCPERDLALLRLTPKSLQKVRDQLGGVSVLQLGNSDSIRRADDIMTLGYPLGLSSLKSTRGVVSGREHVMGRQMIQIDAPINPGNSGGPALDINGLVVGINTGGYTGAQNVNVIIPINELKLVLKELYNAPHKLLRKPTLGAIYHSGSVALTNFLDNPQPGGCYVSDVFKGSLLETAGVKAGDMLYSINGHRVDMYGEITVPWSEDKISIGDFASYIPLNSKATIGVYRHGRYKELSFTFTLGKLPAIRQQFPGYEPFPTEMMGGMVIMQLTRNHIPLLLNIAPELIRFEEPKNQTEPTLVVTHIIPDSVAQRSRVIAPGNRIQEVNGVTVTTIQELRDAFAKSVTNGLVRVKLTNGVFAVFSLEQIMGDEPRLSALYHYPISSVIEQMYTMKQYHEQQKASGSQAA